MRPARAAFMNGMKDQLPILLGVVPFGLIFGALAISEGIPPLAAQGFSLFVFAGTAQFIAVQMIGANVSSLVVVLTILIVNLRHVLYSATLATHFDGLTRLKKSLLAWLLTDEAFATSTIKFRSGDKTPKHSYFLGTALALWLTWQASTAAGILFGSRVPSVWNLNFALPLTFIALMAPSIDDRPSLLAAISAGAASLVMIELPFRLGLLIATLFGVAVGSGIETFKLSETSS